MQSEVIQKVPSIKESMSLAEAILADAAKTMTTRAKQRDDSSTKERSMKSCVEAFNAMYGTNLTVTQGYVFMLFLKLSRAKGGDYHFDDWLDLTAYSALAGEEAYNENIKLLEK